MKLDMKTLDYKIQLMRDLDYATKSCRYCLDNVNGSVDMHGLEYWASRVESLRNKIRGVL